MKKLKSLGMMYKMTNAELHHNQRGLVAIFSVMIIMGILTLLIVGFSTSVRQAQERTLDDQLSTQAFYAAETGVNKALEVLRAGMLPSSDDCTGGIWFDPVIYPAHDVEVSCMLTNVQPSSLVYDFVPVAGDGDPVTLSMYTTRFPADIFEFSWDAPSPADPIPTTGLNGGNPEFLTDRDWGNRIGVLKLDMVQANSTSRATLIDNTVSFYLYPTTQPAAATPPTILPGAAQQGQTVLGHCDATPDTEGFRCHAFVSIPSANGVDTKVRAQAFYNPVGFSIKARSLAAEVVEFKYGQAIIDSTGRAGDVFKRIQVRAPIEPAASPRIGHHPPFNFLSEDSLCKRIIAIPGASIVDTSVSSIPACSLPSGGGPALPPPSKPRV